MELLDRDASMSHQSEASPMVNFLKKPLYYWVKSFAEKEIHAGDTFKAFVGSNAVAYALEYIGITTESEQSSLHLSAIFDEDGPTSFNGNRNSSLTKFSTHFESETKSRIQHLSKVFNDLKSFFEDNFSQLVLIRPPNSVHISCSCHACCVAEFEKILILLLGGAIQGIQRQDTIRKIKSYPANIQEALIEAIKLAADNPELLHIKAWSEYAKLPQDEQQPIYERLLALTRQLLMERNELFQAQLLSDYIHGYTSCEQKRNLNEWKCCEIYEAERNSNELKSTATMRQLRDELLEKSELLQECREELEITKVQMKNLQDELAEAQKQLKSFKKARDELDVMRESQEKAQRLEAELQRMKKKLEDSEQYYERIEILQNENRNFQLKHAILMDQINMLTVDKERLELSFLTQSHYKGIRAEEEEELDLSSLSLRNRSNLGKWDGQLLIDTTDVGRGKETPGPERCSDENTTTSTPATSNTAVSADLLEDVTPIAETPNCSLPILRIEEPELDIPTSSEKQESPADVTLNAGDCVPQTPADAEIAPDTSVSPITSKEKKTKRQSRKGSTLNTKRTRRALFSPSAARNNALTPAASSSPLRTKAKLNGSVERLSEPESSKIKASPKGAKRSQRRRHQGSLGAEDNDADEELSLSPNIAAAGEAGVNSAGADVKHEEVNEEEKENRELPEMSTAAIEYPDTTTIVDARNNDEDDAASNLSVGSSDNELFFICSSNATTPATNSNLKIANGRNVPIPQITTAPSTLRPSDSDPEDNNGHPHCLRNHYEHDAYTHDLLTNCNIQLSLRHVNSHDVNIGHPNAMFEYPNATGGISSSTAYVNRLPKYSSSSTPPVNFNLACPANRPHRHATDDNDESSSEEDDDSVWYEYGCV